uniref:Uncharacterized protein n=1 Tax=Toxoplasma gondii TgCATBr9 TaxID=943120 RepID=A0A2T6IXW3_TOXGO|nr:hypothetical protein TGBR9_381540 [Toxoplasma gondii TgCATBr9]
MCMKLCHRRNTGARISLDPTGERFEMEEREVQRLAQGPRRQQTSRDCRSAKEWRRGVPPWRLRGRSNGDTDRSVSWGERAGTRDTTEENSSLLSSFQRSLRRNNTRHSCALLEQREEETETAEAETRGRRARGDGEREKRKVGSGKSERRRLLRCWKAQRRRTGRGHLQRNRGRKEKKSERTKTTRATEATRKEIKERERTRKEGWRTKRRRPPKRKNCQAGEAVTPAVC